jgi:hypothetical protein
MKSPQATISQTSAFMVSPVVPSDEILQVAVITRPLTEVANRGAAAAATISLPLLM